MTALPASGSFAMVDPTHVAAVGPAAAILFARITWRCQSTDGWVATRGVLMEETGLTENMLRTAITVLREAVWVETRRASVDDATLVWTPIHAGHADIVESTPPPGGIHHTPPVESTISSLETVETTTTVDTSTDGSLFPVDAAPVSSPAPQPADDTFPEFWEVYPRKVGKGAARKAYAKAVRSAPADVILAGLRRQLPELATALRDGKDYRPHPTTWLNAERWADEVVSQMRPPKTDAFADVPMPEHPRTDPWASWA